MNSDEKSAIRAAFTASLFDDPFRDRDAVMAQLAESTGVPPDDLERALPSPGSPAWVSEFSPSRTLEPLSWDRDVDELRTALSGPVDGRWSAMRALLSATVPSDKSRSLLLEIIRGTDTYLRISAIQSGWRHFEGRAELKEALREIIGEVGAEKVRIAAIRRVGMDVDRDPRSVTTLMAALAPSEPIAVRTAAIQALATTAQGYPRAAGLVARGMTDDDNTIRAVSYAAVCDLVHDDTEAWLIEQVVRAMAQQEPLVGAYAAFDTLWRRRPDVMRSVLPQLEDALPQHRQAAVELASLLTRSDDVKTVSAVLLARHDPDAGVRSAVDLFVARLRARNGPRNTVDIWRGNHPALPPDVEALLE